MHTACMHDDVIVGSQPANKLAISGDVIAVASDDKTIKLFDFGNGAKLGEVCQTCAIRTVQ